MDEIHTSFKEDVKDKMLLTQNMQELHDTMKRPNQRIIVIEETEDTPFKGLKYIFNKNRRELF